MTKIIDGALILTYDEWSALPDVQQMYSELGDCKECGGEGTHKCLCGDEHECNMCRGSGKSKALIDIYNRTLKNEVRKLADWNNGKPIVAV